jgi:hypothetical protein
MGASRYLHRCKRLLAVMVLLCALLGRVAVPTGYMIAASNQNGLPVFQMCNGSGPMAMATDARHNPDQHEEHKSADHPCAFAAASTAVDLAAVLHPVAPTTMAAATAYTALSFARPGLGLAAPPPPKTGPPFLI